MSVPGRTMRWRQAGLTLIELMVVVAIVGILLTVGIPGMRDLLVRTAMSSKLNDMVGAIQTARSEAVTRNSAVTLCRLDPASPQSCTTTGGWQGGWLAYVDADADGTKDGGEEIVGSSGAVSSNFTFKDTLGAATALIFRPDGTPVIGAAAKMKICRGTELAGEVSLDLTGRASAKKLDSASGCP